MRGYQAILLAAAAALFGGAAFAADLPTRKGAPMAPPPIAPAFTWQGFYLGGFAGGNWSHVTPHDLTNPGGGDPVLNSMGLTAGGLGGYNWAFNNFVIGAEAEAGLDYRGATGSYVGAGGGIFHATDYGRAEGRARGRIGYSFGNWLLFAAGGATVADLKLTYGDPAGFAQEINKWRGGFNVGGGLEWAITDHWILRGEYIYDQFRARSYEFNSQNPAFDSQSGKLSESTARAAIAYKF